MKKSINNNTCKRKFSRHLLIKVLCSNASHSLFCTSCTLVRLHRTNITSIGKIQSRDENNGRFAL